MKRQAALVTLGLLAGLGLGYAVGVHRAPATTPTGAATPTAAAPAVSVQSGARGPGPTEKPAAALTVEEAKRKLAAWVAAGCPQSERKQALDWLEVWSAAEPQAALAFVFTAPRFPGRNGVLAIPLSDLCRRDAKAVIAWLHANIPEQERGRIAEMVIQRIHKEAPREALALAEAEQTPVGGRTYGLLLGTMIRDNPTEALAAFGRLTDGARGMTAAAIANSWVETDPAAALRWIESLRNQPGERNAQGGVMAALLKKDPTQALAGC